MVCFCKMPLAHAPARIAPMLLQFSPPKIPIALRAAAVLPLLTNEDRLDIKIALAMQNIRLPSIAVAGGPLVALALKLQLAGGTFTIDDLPTLAAEIRQTAHTLNRHVLPSLRPLLDVKLPPLLQLALVARLKLDLPALKWDAMLGGTAPTVSPFRASLAIPRPQILPLSLAAALPQLLALSETLKVPIGEQGAARAMSNHLRAMAGLGLPTLSLTIPQIIHIAMVLEAIAKIEAAFGSDAMTPAGLSSIAAQLKILMALPMPPLPDLELAETIAMLPELDSIKAGERGIPSSFGAGFKPPTIQIEPFLMATIQLQASLDALSLSGSCADLCSAPLPNFSLPG